MRDPDINIATMDALSTFVFVLIKSVDETTRAQIEHRLTISINNLQRGDLEYPIASDSQLVAEILSRFLEVVRSS